jgi:hypothetical protein
MKSTNKDESYSTNIEQRRSDSDVRGGFKAGWHLDGNYLAWTDYGRGAVMANTVTHYRENGE